MYSIICLTQTIISFGNKTYLTSLSLSEKNLNDTNTSIIEVLPFECLSRVLIFVDLPEDLATASLASNVLANIVEDEHFWKTLTLRNFNNRQISVVNYGRPGWRTKEPVILDNYDWKRAYIRLLKRYGNDHNFSTKLAICEVCFCLFWPVSLHFLVFLLLC